MQQSPSSETASNWAFPARVLLVITDQDTDMGMDPGYGYGADTESGSVILRPLFSGRIG
jgi:hypothetical protein